MTPPSAFDASLFASTLLERGAEAYAFDVADSLASRRPDLAQPFGDKAVPMWRSLFATHLRELAAAVAARRALDFSRQVTWAHVAYRSREFPSDFLREGVRELRRILSDKLPPAAVRDIDGCLASALAEIEKIDANGQKADAGESARAPLHPLADRYVRHLLLGDRGAAIDSVLEAVAAGKISVQDAYLSVCLPAQREIGRLWHRNEISIAVEHFVSAATQCVMSALFSNAKRATPIPKTVLCSAVSGDRHEIGLRCVSDFLALEGFRTIFLGADIPPDDIAAGVVEFEVDLVVLSATLFTQRRAAMDTIREIRALKCPPRHLVPVLVGGGAFDRDESTWRAVGADGHAAGPEEAVAWARAATIPTT